VEFQKIKTTIMIEGMLLFQNALWTAEAKEKHSIRWSLITLEESAGDANHYSIGDNGFYTRACQKP
jgi:hypothetical protein